MYIYTEVPPSYENFGKTFPLSGTQFAHLYNGELKEIRRRIHGKHFPQSLANRKLWIKSFHCCCHSPAPPGAQHVSMPLKSPNP